MKQLIFILFGLCLFGCHVEATKTPTDEDTTKPKAEAQTPKTIIDKMDNSFVTPEMVKIIDFLTKEIYIFMLTQEKPWTVCGKELSDYEAIQEAKRWATFCVIAHIETNMPLKDIVIMAYVNFQFDKCILDKKVKVKN